MYLFSKFPLLSAPFYRILKKFTVGAKKAHTFGSVGVLFDAFSLKNYIKTKKMLDFGHSRYFELPQCTVNELEMAIT